MKKHQPLPRKPRRQLIDQAIRLPLPPAQRLQPTEVGAIMKRARKLGRQDLLTPYDHRVLDALLFQCRNPISGAIVVSYSALKKITGISKVTIVKAVARLLNCGLLNKIRRRLRVVWHQGGTASLQAPNAYSFNVPGLGHTESATQTVQEIKKEIFISQSLNGDAKAARAALAEIGDRRRRQAEEARRERIALAMKSGRFIAG